VSSTMVLINDNRKKEIKVVTKIMKIEVGNYSSIFPTKQANLRMASALGDVYLIYCYYSFILF
jgi:hypothetical protein